MKDPIQNYIKANTELREYLNINGHYDIDFKLKSKWNGDDEYIGFGDEDTEEYSEEVIGISKNEKYTTFLVRSCFGDGNYYIVFDNKNYLEE